MQRVDWCHNVRIKAVRWLRLPFRLLLPTLLLIIFFGCKNRSASDVQDGSQQQENGTAESVEGITRLIAKDSANTLLFFRRAELFYDNGEYHKALSDVGRVIRADSLNAAYYLLLSDIYAGLNNLPNSRSSLERAALIDPNNQQVYLKLAQLSLITLNYKEAIELLDRVMNLNNLNPEAIYLRGIIFLETGDTVRAIRNLQRAVEIKPDYFDPNMQLGSLFAIKNNKLALDYYNNALNIDPANLEAKYAIALFLQESGEYVNAINAYSSIVADNPEFVFAHYNMGYIELVYLHNYNNAIDHFSRVIELNPNYADAHYNKGFCYELLGNVERSGENYRNATRIDPGHTKAIAGLNRIDKLIEGK